MLAYYQILYSYDQKEREKSGIVSSFYFRVAEESPSKGVVSPSSDVTDIPNNSDPAFKPNCNHHYLCDDEIGGIRGDGFLLDISTSRALIRTFFDRRPD